MIYADVQPCLSEVQTVLMLDDDAVVYAEVNHEITPEPATKTAANSQLQTCVSKQSEDGCNQDHQSLRVFQGQAQRMQ